MKKKRDHRMYLQDMLSAVERIKVYTVKGRKEFFSNMLIQDGTIRQLSILGEAAAKLPASLRARFPNIPWKDIIGMRNIVIHDYSDTDLPTIWDTVKKDLTPLKKTVQEMLDTLSR